jgi:hypothetical protein
MAKKKQSIIRQFFYRPISLPLFGFFTLLGSGLVVVNLSLLLQDKESLTVSSISQKTLQDALGSTMSIGNPQHSPGVNHSDPAIQYWQEIVKLHPDYQDAYIVLAILSFNKKHCADTKFYVDKANSLDPNNKMLQEIIPKLTQCLEK